MEEIRAKDLLTFDLLEHVDLAQASQMLPCCERRSYEAGEILFADKQPAAFVFLIEKGSAEVKIAWSSSEEITVFAAGSETRPRLSPTNARRRKPRRRFSQPPGV